MALSIFYFVLPWLRLSSILSFYGDDCLLFCPNTWLQLSPILPYHDYDCLIFCPTTALRVYSILSPYGYKTTSVFYFVLPWVLLSYTFSYHDHKSSVLSYHDYNWLLFCPTMTTSVFYFPFIFTITFYFILPWPWLSSIFLLLLHLPSLFFLFFFLSFFLSLLYSQKLSSYVLLFCYHFSKYYF